MTGLANSPERGAPAFRIVDARVYAGRWLVCDLLTGGTRPVARTVREGKLYQGPEGEVDWLGLREVPEEPHWLDWLFEAPEPRQQRFVIRADGSGIEWPDLGRVVSVEELLASVGAEGLGHRWQRARLRREIDREELAGFWKNLDTFRLVELRPDGGCEQKETFRGRPARVAGTFTWSFDGPRQFRIRHEFERPLPSWGNARGAGVPPGPRFAGAPEGARASLSGPAEAWFRCEVMRFDGRVLELLETSGNGVVVTGPRPIWWARGKPPRGVPR